MAEKPDLQLSDQCEDTPEVSDKRPEDVQTPTEIKAQAIPVTTKYEWYQTESHVIIAILQKNTAQEDVQVSLTEDSLCCTILSQCNPAFSLELELAHPIVPMHSNWKALSSKVEIRLKKAESVRWSDLKRDIKTETRASNHATTGGGQSSTTYPSSCVHKKDWDKIVVDIKKEEEEEKPTGEAALNVLFQKIYTEGSDDVRRAMNKSFVESGGTVLSTNWQEVGSNRVGVKPPDGLEWRQWNQ